MGRDPKQASGSNDQGWIAGDAYNSSIQQTHAFLLTPVPEPETYAMLLFGLGLMGMVVRRKKQPNPFRRKARGNLPGAFHPKALASQQPSPSSASSFSLKPDEETLNGRRGL